MELGRYGFTSYLSDMYDAPDAVNAFLCQQKNLHQVPLFEKDTPTTDELSNLFKSYYVGNAKYTVKKSKYSGEISKGIEDIGSRRVIRLSDSVDKSRMEEVETEMMEKDKQRKNHEGRLNIISETISKIEEAVGTLSKKIHVLETKKKEAAGLQNHLKLKQTMLQTLLEPKVNIEEEKRKIAKCKQELVAELCKRIQGLKAMTVTCGKLDLKKRCKLLQIQNVDSENQEQTEHRKELEE